jgi:hypothetical protein
MVNWINLLFSPFGLVEEVIGEPVLTPSMPAESPSTPEEISDSKARATRFLLAEGAILAGAVALPAAYIAYKGQKKGKKAKRAAKDDKMLLAMNDASNRAVSLLAAIGPAVLLPVSYITVQKLEDAGVITKGLGDATQTLMTVAAAGQVASGIGSIVKAVI